MKGLSFDTKTMQLNKVNWFALIGGTLTLVLAVCSLFVPWWKVTVGQTLGTVSFSPVKMSLGIFGYDVAVPIITAISWMLMALLISAGVVLVVYSIAPSKPYSKPLLSFAYKKPLGIVIAFIVLMLLVTNAGSILGTTAGSSNMKGADLNVPWTGSKTLQLPSSMAQGAIRGIAISTEFEWTFWLAITVAALCVASRLYHKKLDRTITDESIKQPLQDPSQP